MNYLVFKIQEITEEQLWTLFINEMAKQEGISLATTLIILAAVVAAVGITLWYFLHPRSPWVRKRQRAEDKKEREEEAQKRKEERRQRLFTENLQRLNFTCKFCDAPGLKGPKCEYCGHINFTID